MSLRGRALRLLSEPAGIVVLQVALLWTVGYIFFVFHGLSFHLTPWSQAFINAIVKYTYGPYGQDDTTVVLFREENLSQFDVPYPVPYRIHAQVFEALASYRPRAVFIDFAFIDKREDKVENKAEDKAEDKTKDKAGEVKDKVELRQLRHALCALSRASVSVFLAAPVRPGLIEPLTAEDSEGICAQLASPQTEENIGVSGVLTYASRGEADDLPTAAFALAATNSPLGLDESSLKGPLEIIWGNGVFPRNRKWMKCADPSMFDWIGPTLRHGPLVNKLACPYTRTITVGHLLSFSGDPDVQRALEGRTVLYGAGFRLTGDVVNSPVYAEMPGVYLHAMAYDNLVTFRRHYKRATRHGIGAMATDAVLLLIASVLLVRYPRTPRHRAESLTALKAGVRRHVLVGGGAVLVVVLAGASGLDAGLLSLLLAYVLYRWWVSKDLGFVLLVIIMMIIAVVYYYVMDLGPRNILAFLVFFEVVRHVEKHLKEAAHRYFELKARETSAVEGPSERPVGPLWQVIDALLARYAESGTNRHGRREAGHEPGKSRLTG